MTSLPPPPPPNFAEGSRSSKLETGEQREKLNLEKERKRERKCGTQSNRQHHFEVNWPNIRRRREGKRQKHTTCHWSRRQWKYEAEVKVVNCPHLLITFNSSGTSALFDWWSASRRTELCQAKLALLASLPIETHSHSLTGTLTQTDTEQAIIAGECKWVPVVVVHLSESLPHHLTTSPYTVHISREKYDHQPARLLFSLPRDAHHRWWYMARRRKWRRKKTKEKDKVVSVARQSVSCQCQIDRRLSSAQSE